MTEPGLSNLADKESLTQSARDGHRAYLYAVVVFGLGVAAYALYRVFISGLPYQWIILTTLAVFAGAITIKIPGTQSKVSISETVIFTSLILIGPTAGTLTAAVDGIMGSFRAKTVARRFEYGLFNAATMILSASLSGWIFFLILGRGPLIALPRERLSALLLPLTVMAFVYYLVNSGLVAVVLALDTGSRIVPIWRQHFLWTSIIYFSGAYVAGFISLNDPFSSAWVGYILPFLLVTYLAYRTYRDKVIEDIRIREIDQLYLSTVEALAMAIDAKDHATQGHTNRVLVYARGLAKAMGVNNANTLRGIEAAALLHDIGNLAVPEYILNKPAKLTPSEFEKVKTHPIVGSNILGTIKFPYPVAEYVRHHHEHWDGTGYPDGLKGEQIPLGSRILAVVDGYEALTCDRTYQKARSRNEAVKVIHTLSGTRYDPEIVARFEESLDRLILEAGELEAHEPESQRLFDAVEDARQDERIARPQPRDFRPFQAISSSQKEVFALYELARSLGTTLNLQETLTIIAGKISKIVPFTTCIIYICSEDKTTLRAEHISGENQEAFKGYSMQLGEHLSGWVAAQKEPAINANPKADLEPIQKLIRVPLENALVYPLVVDEVSLGVISLYAAQGKSFRYGHFHVMEIVAQQAATAVYNALKFEGTREDALTDGLTSLPNIRFLHLYLEQELAKSKRYSTPLSLLVMDLDGFKNVNDTYGHQVGDRVLTEVAGILKGEMRGSDVIVRYGGDEFVAVLPGAAQTDADVLIERIRASIRDFKLVVAPGEVVGIGISIGSATSPEDGEKPDALLKAADGAMYRDKADRRSTPVSHAPAAAIE
jgi:diguanylate cyclase (GGDEF)-like protein